MDLYDAATRLEDLSNALATKSAAHLEELTKDSLAISPASCIFLILLWTDSDVNFHFFLIQSVNPGEFSDKLERSDFPDFSDSATISFIFACTEAEVLSHFLRIQ